MLFGSHQRGMMGDGTDPGMAEVRLWGQKEQRHNGSERFDAEDRRTVMGVISTPGERARYRPVCMYESVRGRGDLSLAAEGREAFKLRS